MMDSGFTFPASQSDSVKNQSGVLVQTMKCWRQCVLMIGLTCWS